MSDRQTPTGSEYQAGRARPAPTQADSMPAYDQAPLPIPVARMPALLAGSRLAGRGNGPVRAAVLQRMQRTYGNRAVQRLLAVQREGCVESDPYPPATTQAIDAGFDQGDDTSQQTADAGATGTTDPQADSASTSDGAVAQADTSPAPDEDETPVQTWRAGTRLPIQRYKVPGDGDADCGEVLKWLNTSSPYRPMWAKTRAEFPWGADYTFSGSGAKLRVHTQNAKVTKQVSVDMPEWSPNDPDVQSAWTAMTGALRTHEGKHEAIAAQWEPKLLANLQAVDLPVAAATTAAADAVVKPAYAGWIAQHQTDQKAIDPPKPSEGINLNCP